MTRAVASQSLQCVRCARMRQACTKTTDVHEDDKLAGIREFGREPWTRLPKTALATGCLSP
jgi:hypothetical protein